MLGDINGRRPKKENEEEKENPEKGEKKEVKKSQNGLFVPFRLLFILSAPNVSHG